jgi:hypothetical protein
LEEELRPGFSVRLSLYCDVTPSNQAGRSLIVASEPQIEARGSYPEDQEESRVHEMGVRET